MRSWQSRVRLMVFLSWGNFTLHRSVCSRSNSIYRRSQRQPSSIEGSRKNGGRCGHDPEVMSGKAVIQALPLFGAQGLSCSPWHRAAPSSALYHRLLRLAVRLAMFVVVFIALLCCGLRVYTAYLAHRAVALLDEAARIQVGATEDSILPLVSRYGGQKQIPPPPEDIENCPNKADCEYQNAHIPGLPLRN